MIFWSRQTTLTRILSMKRFLSVAAAVAFSTVCGAEMLTEYEARNDTSQDGMYLLFVSRPVSENAPAGDAFMTLGKGETPSDLTPETHFGIIVNRGIPKLRQITDDEASAIRNSEEGQPVLVSAVRVDQAQYDEISAWLTDWCSKESFDIQDANALLDCTQEVLRMVGFDWPYRSGLMVPHIMNYYGDIQITNRKMAV
jgi:hypothetical protein